MGGGVLGWFGVFRILSCFVFVCVSTGEFFEDLGLLLFVRLVEKE